MSSSHPFPTHLVSVALDTCTHRVPIYFFFKAVTRDLIAIYVVIDGIGGEDLK